MDVSIQIHTSTTETLCKGNEPSVSIIQQGGRILELFKHGDEEKNL
jgi:hypothetical protein